MLAHALAEPSVRVLLEEAQGPVTVVMTGPHRGFVDGQLRFETSFALSWPLVARDGALWVEGRRLGRRLTLEPTSGIVSYQGRAYRGSLSLVARGAMVEVINVVGIEAYLRGVVPAEVPASWPMAALKAQAVASRTYTLASLTPESDYDICATQDCQVYGGMAAEHARSDQAVAETSAMVLTYGGGFAHTYYHADSGGYLASSAEVWHQDLPYLPARRDAAGGASSWTLRLDPARMAASLRARGWNVGQVESLEVLERSVSGRAARAVVTGTLGRVVLEGAPLRTLLRGWGLKSTLIHMRSAMVVQGSGRGHGVGMSQVGARRMAAQGYGFDQILGFYYPGTLLQALPYRQLAGR